MSAGLRGQGDNVPLASRFPPTAAMQIFHELVRMPSMISGWPLVVDSIFLMLSLPILAYSCNRAKQAYGTNQYIIISINIMLQY